MVTVQKTVGQPVNFVKIFTSSRSQSGARVESSITRVIAMITLTHPNSSLRFPFKLVAEPLAGVEQAIRAEARAFDPGVEGYVDYVCGSSGKRIRPALALLAGGATGGCHEGHQRLGLILELIHVASLVHDDIMDGAATRRSMPTAAAKWGSSLSVLLGDALFAHALELATSYDDVEMCREISRAARDVCSGEILQTQRRFDLNLTVEEYLRILRMKTGALFTAATGLGARLNDQPDEIVTALRNYGALLGTAYQIYDDCVDLVGSEEKAGKTLGTDLAKGKLTLPVLYLLESASESQKDKLSRMLIQRAPLDVNVLAGIADSAGAVDGAVALAVGMVRAAADELKCLPGGKYRDALVGLTDYLTGLLQRCRLGG